MKINQIKIFTVINLFIIFGILEANSRVAFSRPGSLLRTPSATISELYDHAPLFSVGFSVEAVNLGLNSTSNSIYINTTIKKEYQLGISYTQLADPRSENQIDNESVDFPISTELSLHFQKRVFSAGNFDIDLGIQDLSFRNNKEMSNPSMFAVFSSKKSFDDYHLIFSYGFGSGRIASDPHHDNYTTDDGIIFDDDNNIGGYLALNLYTPIHKKLKNRLNFLLEYDGTGLNLGSQIPITNEYSIFLGLIHFNNIGNFQNRTKENQQNESIMKDAPTVSFGFKMNVPSKKQSKPVSFMQASSSHEQDSTLGLNLENIDSELIFGEYMYTEESVQKLIDSLNTIITLTENKYETVSDSIRFAEFTAKNLSIENSSLLQNISELNETIDQHDYEKLVSMKDLQKSMRHMSRSLNNFFEKDFHQALVEIDRAIDLSPNLALAYARKAAIYYAMGQSDKASINWNIALKLDPEYDEVRNMLEALKSDDMQAVDVEIKN